MSFLKRFFGAKADGNALAESTDRSEYAQIHLLMLFEDGAFAPDEKEEQRWSRVLPRTYREEIAFLTEQGWLEPYASGYRVTETGQPFLERYRARLERARTRVMAQVRQALAEKDPGAALELRRAYEAGYPLGTADWTGPTPQLSRSSLTRRILYLDHWLLDGLSSETVDWLKLYAAEQHLWGASWRLPDKEIPAHVREELAIDGISDAEAVYWKAHQLALLVDNQETWQRCKGGDHVRRIEIVAADDELTCAACRAVHGQEYLVARAPELPHRTCTSAIGCRCRYEPVLESYADLE